ncbi:MAG: hypothetical protein ACRDQZ_25820 [Mycobacteriales bacterium]
MTGQSRSTSPGKLEKPDWIVRIGTYAIGASAAIVSFTGLSGLALMAGFTQHVTIPFADHVAVTVRMCWLFPLFVDAYAAVGARPWLRPRTASPATQTYAKRSALSATGLTITGNGIYHALTVTGPPSGMWHVVLAVSVGAIAPVMLGLVLHLQSLCSNDAKRAKVTHVGTVNASPPVEPSDRPKRSGRRTRKTKPTGPVTPLPGDVEDLEKVRTEPPAALPSRNYLMAKFRCGTGRAERLVALLQQEREGVTT